MELLQLRYFLDSAKTQSFTKTAEKHWVPASSVSASIKRLEDELGCKLFDRKHNSITLNENGKIFQSSISYIFDELNSVTNKLKNQSSGKNEIKLLIKSMRNEITNRIIEYNQTNKDVKFKTDYTFNNVDYDQFDIIIDQDNPSLSNYEKFEYSSTQLCLRVSNDHPFANKTVRLIDLRNQPFITMGESSNMHKFLLKACAKAGFTPNIVLQTNDTNCYHKAIVNGLGVGVSRILKNNTNSAIVNVTDLVERQTIYVFYRREKLFPALSTFLEYLKTNT